MRYFPSYPLRLGAYPHRALASIGVTDFLTTVPDEASGVQRVVEDAQCLPLGPFATCRAEDRPDLEEIDARDLLARLLRGPASDLGVDARCASTLMSYFRF